MEELSQLLRAAIEAGLAAGLCIVGLSIINLLSVEGWLNQKGVQLATFAIVFIMAIAGARLTWEIIKFIKLFR